MRSLISIGWRKLYRTIDTYVGLLLCRQSIRCPIFILGCGRSGTTILGTVLARHPAVTYLNERRDLWAIAYPMTDIWSRRAESRGGKLVMTAHDEVPGQSTRLKRLFMWQTIRSRRPVLVEKLPINNFRLSFLRTVFPDARYIHILRNGAEVARSIEREAIWYTKFGYRWKLLSQYAQSRQETLALPDFCADDFEKGLLEWRLSLDALYSSMNGLTADRFLEITYADLVELPRRTTTRIVDFLELPEDAGVIEFASSHVSRRSPKITGKITEKEFHIAGPYLQRWQA
jgi:hypothetical protein